jgi:O-succinylbenzoate synthase
MPLSIARVGLRGYDLPLRRPIRVGGAPLARRSGILVLLEDREGNTGIGETAPLPGLHEESAADALRQLRELAPSLAGARVPADCPALEHAFADWLAPHGLHPSVRFGVEGAVLALVAAARGTDLPRLLGREPATHVRINGLLEGDPETVLQEASHLRFAGYGALKLKVGRGTPDEEARLVGDVRRVVGDDIALRLDANRAWELDAAVAFARRVRPARIEYVEEPLRNPEELPRFFAMTGVPVALDETLGTRSPGDGAGAFPGVAAFVLKPEALGGFERTMAWVRCAAGRGIQPVISAAFPAAAGLALEAAFAAAAAPGTVHGLGTFAALAEDLARRPIAAPGGEIEVAALPRGPADFLLERTRALD